MSMSVAAVGQLSRSASRAIAKAANGFHLLRIEGYSETEMVLPGQRISSEDFTVGDYSWRVDCYPNGRDTSTKSNAMSVYLQLTDQAHRALRARYKFSLLDRAGHAGYEVPAETASFTSVSSMYNYQYRSPVLAAVDEQGPGCGHEEFIGREELERRREDLIRDDRIVLRCDVGVTQIEGSCLATDELSDEEEDEQYYAPEYGEYCGYGGPPRQRRLRRRTDDDEYVKWCLTEEPRRSRGYRQVRHRRFGHPNWY
jgi:speckle-type POZ protein